jgi:uncharacterized protein (TIGR03437 family)
MRTFLTKLSILAGFSLLALAYLGNGTRGRANANNAPLSHTGAPALGAFPAEPNCTACHSGTLNSEDATVSLAVAPFGYLPNQELQVSLSVGQPGRARYGFQATALDAQGRKAGEFLGVDQARLQVANVTTGALAGRSYIQNTGAGSDPRGASTINWGFKWKAPAQSVGRVTIYFAISAANNNGQSSGDATYTSRLTIDPATPLLTLVSAASFLPGTPVAPEAIVAAFGENLATRTTVATTVPIPTTLDALQLKVKDGLGVERAAPLFLISPTQLNFLIPPGTSEGRAIVSLYREVTTVAEGAVNIENVSPGIFTANATGQGVAAAIVVRVKANGQQSFESVARLNPTTNRFETVPIDLGPADEQVYLILFGTGFRYRNAQTPFSCAIGGQNAEALWAGAQGTLIGLDQANIRLPRTLIGRGNVNVTLQMAGKTTNPVLINIK